jgi:hypothetical protein
MDIFGGALLFIRHTVMNLHLSNSVFGYRSFHFFFVCSFVHIMIERQCKYQQQCITHFIMKQIFDYNASRAVSVCDVVDE